MKLSLTDPDTPSSVMSGRLCVDDLVIDSAASVQPLTDGGFDAFKDRLARSRVEFALAVAVGNELWAAVDKVRSLPLFYATTRRDCLLSDDPYWLREHTGVNELQFEAAAELWHLLYVLRDGTLARNVRQLRPGEALRVRKTPSGPQAQASLYYRYRSRNERSGDTTESLIEKMDRLHLDVFTELVQRTTGRTIVVPLSGGLDSRLIACMLRRMGVNDVICFSYGMANSAEARISREVAEFLGYRWRFIPYRREDWDSPACIAARRRFGTYSSRLCAVPPVLEDWLAVGLMKQRGELPVDAVFCPGHTAAFTSGRRALAAAAEAPDPATLAHLILRINSPRLRWYRPGQYLMRHMQSQIERTLMELTGPGQWNGAASMEAWNWHERQSKRIVNMVRAYEFWGFEWQVPLWDARLVDFWASVPAEARLGKSLYRRYLAGLSESRFFGLFNGLRNDGSHDPLPARTFGDLARRPLQRHSLGRYFLADKAMERLVAGSWMSYLHSLGTRVLSSEPVTSPWLLLEQEGVAAIWQREQASVGKAS